VTAGLTSAVGAGKDVRVLTNSLVANDVAAVHGGYSRYREPLLKGGVRLWELKPQGGKGNSSLCWFLWREPAHEVVCCGRREAFRR
jgi:putative cardiolipin synthase